MEVLYRLSYRGIFCLCGGGRIRTSVGEAGRFTVCSLWPLGHTPGHALAALCGASKYGSKRHRLFNGADPAMDESPGRDSNPRPAAYKAAALPLSYPGATPQASRRTLRPCGLRSSARFGLRPTLVSTLRLTPSLVGALRPCRP